MVLAVIKPQTTDDAAAPAPTTLGELLESLDIVPGISEIAQWTSQPGSSHIRLGSGKPQLNTGIASFAPGAEPASLCIQRVKPVEPPSCCRCIKPPQLITI